MTEPDVGAYAHTLIEEVRTRAEVEECGHGEAFTHLVLEQFCADGYTEDAVSVPYGDHGLEVSGYGSSSDDRCLDLFLTSYSPRADEDHKVDRGSVEAAFRRLENFLVRCLAGKLDVRSASPELAEMSSVVKERFDKVESIRFLVVTNARSVLRDPVRSRSVLGRVVTCELWDLRRLANWAASGSRAEPIVAEFATGLDFLETPRTQDDCAVLLSIVPASELANLYSTHGARLLELNVRSFLQLRAGVNRGILDTLKNNPERFLAYNNGIAATASRVDTEDAKDGRQLLRRIHNLQIVNGGQTTATIHHARRNKIDISRAFVQMKLTVMPPDQLDDIVPKISEYSNTQNKVTASDLKANSAFHVDVERIMRTLWAPPGVQPTDTHWFYERARGQYANALARERTPARQKIFKAANPPSQRFTKSDLAKFEHSWAMRPHDVSRGAEKNFALFSEESTSTTVDKDYCCRLVAKAILFRQTDKIVMRQKFGGYKANIVTYTVAKLVHATGQRIDLDRIWRDQKLSPAMQDAVTSLCQLVQKVITSPPAGRKHVSEWAKRPECWDSIRELDWQVPVALEVELVNVDTYSSDLALIRGTTPADWQELAGWGSRNGLGKSECHTALDIADALQSGWDPAGKHVRTGVALMRHARKNGFRAVNGF